MLVSGKLQKYIDDYSVTGLTSNPSIFDAAIASGDYDDAIVKLSSTGLKGEDLFFALAIEDLQQAADLFLPIHKLSAGVDGWVSLEVSPLLAHDTNKTIKAAKTIHERAGKRNLFVKIPGTPEGLGAIESCIASGIPINVTLLFSSDHYRGAAEAYQRGIEYRIQKGLDPIVGCVASVFMSRWDVAIANEVPDDLRDQLALSIGKDIYREYRESLDNDRWQRLANSGARPQRLLWASTKTKDPNAPDTLYVHGLAAPLTINTMPGSTLEAFFDHGNVGEPLPQDGGDAKEQLSRFEAAGIKLGILAKKLQDEGAVAFIDSWNDLLARIEEKISSHN